MIGVVALGLGIRIDQHRIEFCSRSDEDVVATLIGIVAIVNGYSRVERNRSCGSSRIGHVPKRHDAVHKDDHPKSRNKRDAIFDIQDKDGKR